MTETWKDIPGYEGLYQVSNLGHIRSLDRITVQNNNGTMCKIKHRGKILPGRKVNGYLKVHVSKNGQSAHLYIHRVVAEVFCEKPDECNIVNHFDCNKENNRADNLEWTTYSGNMQWASVMGTMKGHPLNLKSAHEKHKIPVIATAKDGTEYEFDSIASACRVLNIRTSRGHVSACCRKDYGYKSTGGYEWRYA